MGLPIEKGFQFTVGPLPLAFGLYSGVFLHSAPGEAREGVYGACAPCISTQTCFDFQEGDENRRFNPILGLDLIKQFSVRGEKFCGPLRAFGSDKLIVIECAFGMGAFFGYDPSEEFHAGIIKNVFQTFPGISILHQPLL